MKSRKVFLLVFSVFVFTGSNGHARLVSSSAEFKEYVQNECDMYVDFKDVSTGLINNANLKLVNEDGNDLGVRMETTEQRYPLPERAAPANTPVVVLPWSFVQGTPDNHRIMGTVNGKPDGQSQFVITFDVPQQRVGLLRMWGLPVTTFLDKDGNEISKVTSSSGGEFVGWVADEEGDKPVGSVVIDGLPEDPEDENPADNNKLYLVGEVDDLYYTHRGENLKSFEIDIEGVSSPVERGTSLTPKITVKNIANYAQGNVRIGIKFYSYEQNQEINILLTRSFNAKEEKTFEYVLPTVDVNDGELVKTIEAKVYAPDYALDNVIICAEDSVTYTISEADASILPFPLLVLTTLIGADDPALKYMAELQIVLLFFFWYATGTPLF